MHFKFTNFINLTCLIVSICWLAIISTTLNQDYDDFKQYWQAAVNLRTTGNPFIALPDPDKAPYVGYFYPPIFAYIVKPFGLLSQNQGQIIWFILNSLSSIAFVFLCIIHGPSVLAKKYWGVVLLGFLVMPFSRLNLQLGQISVFMGLGMVGAFILARLRPWAAGLLLSLCIWIRIFPALLLLPLFKRRLWQSIIWTGGWGIGILVLSLGIYGIAPFQSFLQLTSAPPTPYPFAAEHNISIYGMLARLLSETPFTAAPMIEASWLITPLFLIGSSFIVFICYWFDRNIEGLHSFTHLGMWLCGMMLISSTNGIYTLVLLLVSFLAILASYEQQPQRGLFIGLFICTLLIAIPPGWTKITPELHVFMHTSWGLLFLTPAFYGLVGYMLLLIAVQTRKKEVPPLGSTSLYR
ncbi:MAG: glycosyltransferase family 87 protein [Oscillochloridaceae bacterium umkhey_bin13]